MQTKSRSPSPSFEKTSGFQGQHCLTRRGHHSCHKWKKKELFEVSSDFAYISNSLTPLTHMYERGNAVSSPKLRDGAGRVLMVQNSIKNIQQMNSGCYFCSCTTHFRAPSFPEPSVYPFSSTSVRSSEHWGQPVWESADAQNSQNSPVCLMQIWPRSIVESLANLACRQEAVASGHL